MKKALILQINVSCHSLFIRYDDSVSLPTTELL